MQRLRNCGVAALLPTLKQSGVGICLGMQLLFDHSEEGSTTVFGIFLDRSPPANRRPDCRCRTWVGISLRPYATIRSSEGIETDEYVYFVHSYAGAGIPNHLATADYGIPVSAMVRKGTSGRPIPSRAFAGTGARILRTF